MIASSATSDCEPAADRSRAAGQSARAIPGRAGRAPPGVAGPAAGAEAPAAAGPARRRRCVHRRLTARPNRFAEPEGHQHPEGDDRRRQHGGGVRIGPRGDQQRRCRERGQRPGASVAKRRPDRERAEHGEHGGESSGREQHPLHAVQDVSETGRTRQDAVPCWSRDDRQMRHQRRTEPARCRSRAPSPARSGRSPLRAGRSGRLLVATPAGVTRELHSSQAATIASGHIRRGSISTMAIQAAHRAYRRRPSSRGVGRATSVSHRTAAAAKLPGANGAKTGRKIGRLATVAVPAMAIVQRPVVAAARAANAPSPTISEAP